MPWHAFPWEISQRGVLLTRVMTPLLDPHGVPLRNTGAGQRMKGSIGGSAMGHGGGYNGWSAQGVDWGCEMGCFGTTPL